VVPTGEHPAAEVQPHLLRPDFTLLYLLCEGQVSARQPGRLHRDGGAEEGCPEQGRVGAVQGQDGRPALRRGEGLYACSSLTGVAG
jgi:hypothetical protein